MNDLQRTTKRITRRTFLKNSRDMFLGLITTNMITGVYSYKWERFRYEVNEIFLKVKNLPREFDGWKIVQFSDVHIGFFYDEDAFKPVVKIINSIDPDIIFFTGDLIEAGNQEPELCTPLLQELKSVRGGKWAVIGNHDMSIKEKVTRVLQNSNFTVLDNTHDFIETNNQRLYIAGIDDVMYGSPSIEKAIDGIPDDSCVLMLAHEPDIADLSSRYTISAQFSGHSHGGQIRMPFFGTLIKQRLARKYDHGLYQVSESKLPLYVNRGIGTTNLPVRLFCRPEITVIYLTK